jgi:hypothetical protein
MIAAALAGALALSWLGATVPPPRWHFEPRPHGFYIWFEIMLPEPKECEADDPATCG